MKILVTGGAGFIGSHLVDKLIAKKHKVIVIDNLTTGYQKFVNPKAKFIKIDTRSKKLLEVFKKERPQVVFHLAAQKSVPFSLKNPALDADININGSLNVIDASLSVKVKKFIFISTGGAIYGETKDLPTPETAKEKPDSPYGNAKLTIDNYFKNYYLPVRKLNYVSLRLANVYGPRQDPYGEAGVIAIFISNLLNNKQSYINGTGKQTRDFIYVDDVVNACIKSISKGKGIYNIGTSKEISISKLYSNISKLINEKKVKYKKAIPGEVIRSVLKCQKAKRELNWKSQVTLEQGIKKTINYFK
ncbi:NAD-dependent epimerase/dehydratase family protein [bacterium]|jgi:UDP-glucose 4-epimerase|nr:NAD-dependent epimerase/dehydratase family protein [bacterium]MBT4122170.1 NAD-dependent epimerase/dehydratase family protein [bacterium]MBT4334969.1 NAD-dependent epimerase/dehydratase family protein [bacterium]MBT4496008.1 NAD-dependent epimerase/dehydratase family protein [bacterium]MBT4764043.1 NAD-dependent epimerase/dehydratase family protein [bacterium]